MRMAQSRALNQRFQLFLPPPEDPAVIHSALTQVIEALAADMIEPSRARALISGLRLCLQSLKKKDSWHDSAYHCDEPIDYQNFAADYNLPKDLDVTMSPEAAFPPPKDVVTDNRQLTTDNCPPDLAAEARHIIDVSRGLPSSLEDTMRFGTSVTPLDAELMEVTRAQGFEAAEKIQQQFERTEQRRTHRRQSSADRERYALISMERNLQHAIERRVAALVARQEVGCPIPPSVGGVGLSAAVPKKPATGETPEKAELTLTGSIG